MTSNQLNMNGTEMRALGSAALNGEEVPGRVVLAPWGRVESQKGVFFVDDESAEIVVRAFQEHGTDLPIDYEHQTLGGEFASPDRRAPAAGWIKSLTAERAWDRRTPSDATGPEMPNREYRYLSPVALIRKGDRKLVGIHSAALTNKPAIVAMEAIVNRTAVSDGGTDDEAVSLCQLRVELHLAEDAGACEVLAAAYRRMRELSEAARLHRSDERIVVAMRAGKLTAGQKAWAEALIAKDEALFEAWLASAPVVVRPGTTTAPALSETERTRRGAATRARAEYRSNRSLSGLTSEEAYVADAMRCA
jgi:phage I-like protein